MADRSFGGDVALITGANGGLGEHFVTQLLDRGVSKVYATARAPLDWHDDRVEPLALDVTDPPSIAAASRIATDVTLLINNAGIAGPAPLLDADLNRIRAIFETNFFGPLLMTRAFAPILAHNGGGTVLNVESIMSWANRNGAYAASKAALSSASQALRTELAQAGVRVVSLFFDFTATPMTARLDVPKNDPADVVRAALEGLLDERYEVLADDATRSLRRRLSAPIEDLFPELR
jgi:NAD(P)-dependent dehydrogenase (short-subunit alcohol dehydrogenase family)